MAIKWVENLARNRSNVLEAVTSIVTVSVYSPDSADLAGTKPSRKF